MLINSDFSRRVVIDTDQLPWLASPQAGVERRMLDRLGGEKARATSLVRYAPASAYPAHQHPGGEEILVLSGTFVDGGVPHPAGSYLRNPPGSAHQPASPEGAVIFVKLWQMDPSECEPVRIDSRDASLWRAQGDRDVCHLFDGWGECVSLIRLKAGAQVLAANEAGAELLLIDGALLARSNDPGASADARASVKVLPRGSWLRLPPGDGMDILAGGQGAHIYLKTGHLSKVHTEPPRC
jgi:hypothetical protein